MSSFEVELELKLTKLNSQIILLTRLYGWKIIGKYFAKKLQSTIDERNGCFRDLRNLIRKKHPEKFIGGEKS